MDTLRSFVENGQPVAGAAPWPHALIDRASWLELAGLLEHRRFTLVALWSDEELVHAAVLDADAGEAAILGIACAGGRYPSLGRLHPPAIRPERALRDLSGIEPDGLPDTRPWLDHGRWPARHPLAGTSADALPVQPVAYKFLPVKGESLHEIPVGPVHAGIIEPGHFRFTASGETVVRLEERLGYVHKGIESLMTGQGVERGATLAARVCGDSTVAYSLAFARAVEAAQALDVPPRAVWLRALMAELERLANHFGDVGAICNDAAFPMMHAQCALLRERVLRASEVCFGHRLMMDRVMPGGVRVDLAGGGRAVLKALLTRIREDFPELVELYDNTASLQDRTVGTGSLTPALALQFGAGGYVGRASARHFDARRLPGYAPYQQLSFEVPVLEDGDVNARVWIRVREIEQSTALIEQILAGLPDGPLANAGAAGAGPGEGAALVEGFRGDIFVSLRLAADGRIARCHLRDPSWFQWPLLEAVIEGNIVADFPLCNKSFNCSYSGHDL